MKKLQLILVFLFASNLLLAQKKVPEISLLDLNGIQRSTSEILAHNGPVLLVFWTTSCHSMIDGLSEIDDEYYESWIKDYNLKIVAVSVDDSRNQVKVAPFVNGQGWDYEVYLDPNEDFMRAMNVDLHPYVFLLDGAGTVLWKKASYFEGDEETISTELANLK